MFIVTYLPLSKGVHPRAYALPPWAWITVWPFSIIQLKLFSSWNENGNSPISILWLFILSFGSRKNKIYLKNDTVCYNWYSTYLFYSSD